MYKCSRKVRNAANELINAVTGNTVYGGHVDLTAHNNSEHKVTTFLTPLQLHFTCM